MLPELVVETADGIQEGRMDLVVSRPGGVTRHLLDIRTVDSRCPSYTTTAAAFREAAQEKQRRYAGAAHALPVEHRGRLGHTAVEALWTCAQDAAIATGARPAALMRTWRRAVSLVTAFELACVQCSAFLRQPPN